MIKCEWSSLKNLFSIKNISLQYVEDVDNYYVHLFDGPAEFMSQIAKTDPKNTDQIDFETNYRANCNGRLVDPSPFAKPEFRTKRSKTSGLVTIAPGESQNIDFLLTEELYTSGGALVFDGAELGDYVTASVYDKDGIVPAPYRPVLAEAWPVMGAYILGEWIQKGSGRHEINTYPLNAKITPGLYLRVTYTAVNSGSNRTVGVNYYLTKKL